jgi:putative Mg2+ transporter-C (MgtC) family protein
MGLGFCWSDSSDGSPARARHRVDMDAWTVATRLTCTVLAGLVLGANREERVHPAGMRTMLLVCCAASVSMIQVDLLMNPPDTHNSIVRLDPMRLPLGILSGMGFIGGGVIVRKGSMVRGLTTAATLWIATVLGLCFGGGQLALGFAGTTIAIATLWGLKSVESRVFRSHRGVLFVDFGGARPDEAALFEWVRQAGFHVRSRRIDRRVSANETHLRLEGHYTGPYPKWSIDFLRAVSRYDGVLRAQWSDQD